MSQHSHKGFYHGEEDFRDNSRASTGQGHSVGFEGGGIDGSQGVYYAGLSGSLLSFFSNNSLEVVAYKVFSFVGLHCKHIGICLHCI